MQVNFLAETIEVDPALVQVAPAFTAPTAGNENKEPRKVIETMKARTFFMASRLLSPIGFVCHSL